MGPLVGYQMEITVTMSTAVRCNTEVPLGTQPEHSFPEKLISATVVRVSLLHVIP